MEDKRNSRKVKVANRIIKVDLYMANIIRHLNSTGIKTFACCSGHGKYPPTIVIGYTYFTPCNKSAFLMKEFISDVDIPRKRRFYKKDKQGFYYIPEVLENVKLK